MFQDVIGVLGGMGSYATLSFFQRLLDAFPGEKEWDRPRILIDNRCTMPSRVRAILYHEQEQELTQQMTDSVSHLLSAGATKIILACNTSHHFLPGIYEKLPQARGKVLSIIDATARAVAARGTEKSVYLLASEGTIDIGIFHKALGKLGIQVLTPGEEEFVYQREIIESVKQKRITQHETDLMVKLINTAPCETVIIGCTEFPIIFERVPSDRIKGKIVIDPLQCVIDQLCKEIR